MADLVDALAEAAVSNFCALTAPLEKALQLGQDIYDTIGGPTGPFDPAPGLQGVSGIRDVFCGVPPRDVTDEVAPQFSGGQCEDVLYVIEYDFRKTNAGTIQTGSSTTGGFGPIRKGPTVVETFPDGDTQETAILLTRDDEIPLVIGVKADPSIAEYTITSVTRADGQPDTCGDPPPSPPESYDPSDFTVSPPVTYDPPSGSPVAINPTFVYSPIQVDVDGSVKVPVKINIDADLDLFAEINLNTGDFNYVVDVDVTPPTPIEDPTETPVLEPPVSNPVTPVEPIQGVIIAVITRVVEIAPKYPGTSLPTATAGAEFYVPRLGTISFLCEGLNQSVPAWTVDIDVKYTEQIVYCPVPWGAVAVSATSQEGISWTVELVVAESERALALRAAGV